MSVYMYTSCYRVLILRWCRNDMAEIAWPKIPRSVYITPCRCKRNDGGRRKVRDVCARVNDSVRAHDDTRV